MMLRVWVDMPELALPLLLDCDRAAVGVDTDVDVELVREPSDAVTTTTVVEVTGSAVVVEDASDDAVVEAESVDDAPAEVLVVVGAPSLVTVLEVVAGATAEVDVVVGADVVSAASVLVVVGAAVEVVVLAVVAEVVVTAALVVAAAVLPLPLASAASSEPCLATRCLLCDRPRRAASIIKAWVTEVADSAATSSFSILVECMLWCDVVWYCVVVS